MSPHNRHSDAGRCHHYIRVVPNLPGFFDKFHLLLVISVSCHRRVVREEVEGVLTTENVASRLLSI
ncbi:hypothetical protein Mapa_010550 [Marchantia paleacea]|nr:hypothetical protein Mapa_010550 [Marchantia paleacea]